MRELTLNEMEEVGGGADWVFPILGSGSAFLAAATWAAGVSAVTVLGTIGFGVVAVAGVAYGVYVAGDLLYDIITC